MRSASSPFESASARELESKRLTDLARCLGDRLLRRDFVIPLLPEVAHELMALALDPSVSLRELEEKIRCEPLVAAKVVAAANTSIYGHRGAVSSLHQAALRLGATPLRELLSQAVAEAYVFTGRARGLLRQQRVHSVAVAHLTRQICARLALDPEHAFLCGLLHDLGQPLILAHLELDPLEGMKQGDPPALAELLHALLGERVARAWRLPDPVGEVARYHHFFRGAVDDAHLHPLVGIVAGADRLAYHTGLGARTLGVSVHEDPIWSELGLDGSDLEGLIEVAAQLGGG